MPKSSTPKPFPTEQLPSMTLLADGFNDALIGWGMRGYTPVAVYDYLRALEVLQKQNGWSWDDALEWMSFNVEGSQIGEHTPIFVRFEEDE